MVMDEYLVKDWMSSNLITITTQATMAEAYQLMEKNRIRRLPVVDEGELKGIVSWGDIREARPSDATSLSIFEIHHLLARMPVAKIMTTDVKTIEYNDTVGKAAYLMLKHRIASLPVIQDGELVGIITASDIFRMVVKTSGFHRRSSRAL